MKCLEKVQSLNSSPLTCWCQGHDWDSGNCGLMPKGHNPRNQEEMRSGMQDLQLESEDQKHVKRPWSLSNWDTAATIGRSISLGEVRKRKSGIENLGYGLETLARGFRAGSYRYTGLEHGWLPIYNQEPVVRRQGPASQSGLQGFQTGVWKKKSLGKKQELTCRKWEQGT